jgi:steroid delta-isomerase-like uncharacterized protein
VNLRVLYVVFRISRADGNVLPLADRINFAVNYPSGTIPPIAVQEHTLSEANITLMKRWFDEVWNQRRTATITELFAPNGVSHGAAEDGSDLRGAAPFLALFERLVGAFPDMKLTVNDAIAQDDKVLIRWSIATTHTGDSLGMPATNKRVTFSGMTLAKIASGKIVEAWDHWDKLGMLQQLGAVPAPPIKAAAH